MKKWFYFIIGIGIFLSSCKAKEEITFDQKGSGTYDYEYKIDMNQYSSMTGDESKNENWSYTILGKDILENSKDSLSKKDYLAHLSEIQQITEKLKNYTISESRDNYSKTFDMKANFKNISEIPSGIEAMMNYAILQDIYKGKDSVENKYKNLSKFFSEVKVVYEYNDNAFSRITILPEKFEEKKDEEGIEKLEFLKDFFSLDLVYHFPKKIKKCNQENATFSLDGKTLNLKSNFIESLIDPEKTNLIVEFEE